jgi:hypothetical protein
MYSGSTLRPMKHIDAWLGAHQKIDRLAYAHLKELTTAEEIAQFPVRKQIIQFEGRDGPDGVKTKTPAQDEPWHYYDPFDPQDRQILDIIDGHHKALVGALAEGNKTRAGFEAAWLAHALVDGLTPAHHYPYEEELMRLRGGRSIESRTTPKEKLIMHGDNLSEKVLHNWQMWGDKGLLATHIAFEVGVAVLILPMRKKQVVITKQDVKTIQKLGYEDYFKMVAREIAEQALYDKFYQTGWTPTLARLVRKELVPKIIKTVTLVWLSALYAAKEQKT